MLPDMVFNFKPTMFQSVGDLIMFHGMIVCGLFILCWSIKELVKEIWEYVKYRKDDV